MKSAYKPIENLSFVEHLILWFICAHEIHENWFPTNKMETTVPPAIITQISYTFDYLVNTFSFFTIMGDT